MNKISRLILITIISINHTAGYNQRYDFNWVFGYDGGKGDPRFGTTLVNFNAGNPLVSFADKGKMVIFEANASISDQQGNLLYYTNGYDVEDAHFNKIPGATDLGIKYWDGLVEPQGVLFLNNPSSDSSKYLFYISIKLNSPHFHVLDLNYLLIEKHTNKVIKFGNVVHDTLNSGCLTACKHANGQDYWILLNKENTNLFYKILVTSLGIRTLAIQSVGPRIIEGAGQAVFSPNGEYFALYESISNREGAYFFLYKFDRCTGELTELQNKHVSKMGFGGISFSPNSKLFYHSSGLVLSQTALSHENPLDNFEEIEIITDQTSWGSQYNLHQLGPDGRIYISNAYSNFVMHRINRPNEPGKSSFPRSNSFALKTLGGYGIPNMPNYRLGPIDGSTCDTLDIDNMPWAWWRHDQDTTDYLNFEFNDLSAYEVTEWEWSFGDGMKSSTQSPVHRYSKNGVYEVCLIAKNKNGADTLCKTLNVGTTATYDHQNFIKIEIFPNPAKEYFVINVLDYNPEKMHLELFDLAGKRILTQRLFEGSNGIELGSVSIGVFAVKIFEQGRLVISEKLVRM